MEMRNEYKLKLCALAMEHQLGVERVMLEILRELFPDRGNPVLEEASTEQLEPPAKRARMEGPNTFFAPFQAEVVATDHSIQTGPNCLRSPSY